ncbi:tpr repeat protein [Ichthyophthirius multifiliis]|uniref:Tpr repeat protein n=1 Tax=Ichthyophthirius multifiliis TaxID=5932 RepID=G0R601_ICHMU|nr:tpr repeat protein [Ichthyophthirius multifiliis]EGR27125.1 tpr repeat protein [Ichthyophthirius multifiliis]|eukprot:XP_004024009.1 tpr repeat protein [Ichthyophthirius multifiliis]
MKIYEDFKEKYAFFLVQKEEFDEAAVIFWEILNDDGFANELTSVWKVWIESLLSEGFANDAMMVIKQCLFGNTNKRVIHNISLWELYIDLEKSFGTFDTLKLAYQKMLDLKIITPFVLLNYAQLLQNYRFYEDAFKVFEAGVQKAKIFYFMYADFEEKYGLLNHMFEIYDRMIVNVQQQDQIDAYNLYISKVAEHLGVTKTRPIFENAINNFEIEQNVVNIGLRFANLERKFGEIDRVRAIYIHVSQFADPRGDPLRLWGIWEDFERHHGNSDTYKEYLRIKRSVLHKFSILPPDVKRIKELVDAGEL